MDNAAFDKVHKRRGSVTQHVDVIDPTFALDLATAQSYSENVFLFIPNLIGTIIYLFLFTMLIF
jgi:hypothetical protein